MAETSLQYFALSSRILLLPSSSLWNKNKIVNINIINSNNQKKKKRGLFVRALVVDPSDSLQNFAQRMEKAWLISKQPRPISCTSCNAEGHIECLWCKGTGFLILGDHLLCEVPSRNTTCLVCHGQGTIACKDCKGTGYIAQWMMRFPPKR